MDTFGSPVFVRGQDTIKGIDGHTITTGVIEHWENEVEGLKDDPEEV